MSESATKKRKGKARGHGEGSIFRRKDGRWCAAIVVDDIDSGSAKRLRKTVYGKTKKAVTDELTKLQGQKLDGSLMVREKLTVAALLDRWLTNWVENLSESSRQGYKDISDRLIKPNLGGVPLEKLRPAHVRALLDKLATDGKGARTRQYVFATLRRALNLAVKLELVPRNACDAVDAPKAKSREVIPLTAEQAEGVLQHAKGTRWEALFMLALSTGLRQGELFALTWDDIDLERGVLSVRHSLEEVNGKLRMKEPKSASGRRAVRLDPLDVALLREHRQRLATEGLAFAGLLFPDSEGKPLRKSNFQRKVWDPIREAVGIESVRFHDLRHSSASVMLQQGIHPKIVQERLGHSTIKLTMDTYSHLLPDAQNEAAGAFHRARQAAKPADGCQMAVNSPIAGNIAEAQPA